MLIQDVISFFEPLPERLVSKFPKSAKLKFSIKKSMCVSKSAEFILIWKIGEKKRSNKLIRKKLWNQKVNEILSLSTFLHACR